VSSYIQIAGDPAAWWLSEDLEASALAELPHPVQVVGPIAGTLLISPKAASIALVGFGDHDSIPDPGFEILESVIYLPSPAGPSAANSGYALLPTTNVDDLTREITALMRNGGRKVLAVGSPTSPSTLILHGETLGFVVISSTTSH
jgi:hypothetical protein